MINKILRSETAILEKKRIVCTKHKKNITNNATTTLKWIKKRH